MVYYKVQETTESKKQDCVSKGWEVYRNKQGEEVKLRHVLEKVSVWVKGIINIVDVGVFFDQSGHAALPWGIVKYLTTVRDHAVRVPKPTNTREYRLASQILMCSAVLLKALNLVLALWRDMSSSKNYIYTMSVKQHPDCRKLLETSTQTFSLTWQESRLTSQAVLGVNARLRLTNGVRICIFHFAGHGSTHRSDPSRSCLLLKTEPLTVASLLETNLRKQTPFLAYLSACGTGQIHDEQFFHESIHLISANQLAGFRHVIGTLWEVEDNLSQDMARLTYEGMGYKGMTDESVCWGLHKATRELRDRSLNVSQRAKDASTSIQKARVEHEGDTTGVRDGNKRDARMPWKISQSTSDNNMHWVPYVQFGV